jgi:hypothetical protein
VLETLLVVGVVIILLVLFNQYVSLGQPARNVITVIVAILLLVYVLRAFGIV